MESALVRMHISDTQVHASLCSCLMEELKLASPTCNKKMKNTKRLMSRAESLYDEYMPSRQLIITDCHKVEALFAAM